MPIDAATAKALFAIIMVGTQGTEALTPQLPLHVEDRGDSWLVTGTPYTSPVANYRMSHMFFRKDTGEVIGIASHGRVPTTEDAKAHWLTIMSQADYDRIFGPPDHLEPNGIHQMIFALHGGLINTAADAACYAAALLHGRSRPDLRPDDLRATEIDGVWHVTPKAADASPGRELLSFARRNGRVLSGG